MSRWFHLTTTGLVFTREKMEEGSAVQTKKKGVSVSNSLIFIRCGNQGQESPGDTDQHPAQQ